MIGEEAAGHIAISDAALAAGRLGSHIQDTLGLAGSLAADQVGLADSASALASAQIAADALRNLPVVTGLIPDRTLLDQVAGIRAVALGSAAMVAQLGVDRIKNDLVGLNGLGLNIRPETLAGVSGLREDLAMRVVPLAEIFQAEPDIDFGAPFRAEWEHRHRLEEATLATAETTGQLVTLMERMIADQQKVQRREWVRWAILALIGAAALLEPVLIRIWR